MTVAILLQCNRILCLGVLKVRSGKRPANQSAAYRPADQSGAEGGAGALLVIRGAVKAQRSLPLRGTGGEQVLKGQRPSAGTPPRRGGTEGGEGGQGETSPQLSGSSSNARRRQSESRARSSPLRTAVAAPRSPGGATHRGKEPAPPRSLLTLPGSARPRAGSLSPEPLFPAGSPGAAGAGSAAPAPPSPRNFPLAVSHPGPQPLRPYITRGGRTARPARPGSPTEQLLARPGAGPPALGTRRRGGVGERAPTRVSPDL